MSMVLGKLNSIAVNANTKNSEEYTQSPTICEITKKEDKTRKYIYYPIDGKYALSKSYINMKCGVF